MALWDTRPGRTAIDIRKGAGQPWQILDVDATMEAASGGGQDVESRWGRNEKGDLEYIAGVVTSNPNRLDFNVMARMKSEKFLSNLKRIKCPVDIRVRQRCGDMNTITDYTESLVYYDAFNTEGPNPSETPAYGVEDNQADVMDTWAMSAGFQDRWVKLAHTDITQQWSDFAFNRIISVGKDGCNGDCGAETSVDDEFWAVTDKDTTPGYLGQPTPNFFYTLDGGATWTSDPITPFVNGDALDVAKAGNYVLAASATNGIAYALIDDIKNNVANHWSAATGIGTTQFPRRIFVVHAGLIFACGGGGYIWKSTDGGATWTVLSAGTVTTNQLNAIAFADENLGWFAGNTGTLVKYVGGTLTLVTVVSGLTSNFNAVATPRKRAREVFLGAANGNIYRTVNTGKSFATTGFPEAGNGSITDLQFVGFRGSVLFILQTNASNKTRVLRDESGGDLSLNQVVVVGSYLDPGNSVINSIAPSSVNFALTAGEKNLTYAFIGRVGRNPVN